MLYHIGKYSKENQKNRGWFIGSFMQNSATTTDAVEIKYTELDKGPTDHGLKTSATYECSIVVAGKARATIDGSDYIIETGDYIAIQPGVPNNLVAEILEPIKIFTIKAPCDPSAKKMV